MLWLAQSRTTWTGTLGAPGTRDYARPVSGWKITVAGSVLDDIAGAFSNAHNSLTWEKEKKERKRLVWDSLMSRALVDVDVDVDVDVRVDVGCGCACACACACEDTFPRSLPLESEHIVTVHWN